MPFSDPDERPGKARSLEIEFGLLLVIQLIILAEGAHYLWGLLSAYF